MAIFKESGGQGWDRSAEDRRRHRQLVEESIKKNIGNIIAEESIIGQSRDKKIKIPIRGIKEYQFIYGKNTAGVGSGDGTERRGDRYRNDSGQRQGKGREGAGNQEGEEIYETEITLDELINYLFDDLQLPDLDRRKLSRIETAAGFRKLGYQRKGIPPRLAKRRSVIEKIKRKQSYKRSMAEAVKDGMVEPVKDGMVEPVKDGMTEAAVDGAAEQVKDGMTEAAVDGMAKTGKQNCSAGAYGQVSGRFPFIEDDLRYFRIEEIRKKEFNAVVICIMDVSGSMDMTKKYLARSFYFLLYQFLRLKYTTVEVVFVAHTTTAREVSESEFFHRAESGGTYISSGYGKALEIIEKRYNPINWNVYAFHCSDGDNWIEDNKKAVESAMKLCEVCNLFGYGEIVPSYYSIGSTIKTEFQKSISNSNFVSVTMSRREDVLPALKKLLDKEGDRD